jgi:hypothetical protein
MRIRAAAMWSALVAFGDSAPEQLGVVFNPASGPGGSLVDPNYVSVAGSGPLIDLLATGAPVYGYVATGYGAKSVADATAEIAKYYSNAWWRGHAVHLSGVFFDEMSNDLADVGYYRQLRDAVRQLDPAAYLIGNPGLSGTIDPGQQPTWNVDDYAAVFDCLVVYEDAEAGFATNYASPEWTAGLADLAMIAHSAASERAMRVDLSHMLGRGARWTYVTDDALPNPYDRLPTFWLDQTLLLPQLLFVDSFEQ